MPGQGRVNLSNRTTSPSPKSSPSKTTPTKRQLHYPSVSPRSQGQGAAYQPQPALVRQGTFTKDEATLPATSSVVVVPLASGDSSSAGETSSTASSSVASQLMQQHQTTAATMRVPGGIRVSPMSKLKPPMVTPPSRTSPGKEERTGSVFLLTNKSNDLIRTFWSL